MISVSADPAVRAVVVIANAAEEVIPLPPRVNELVPTVPLFVKKNPEAVNDEMLLDVTVCTSPAKVRFPPTDGTVLLSQLFASFQLPVPAPPSQMLAAWATGMAPIARMAAVAVRSEMRDVVLIFMGWIG